MFELQKDWLGSWSLHLVTFDFDMGNTECGAADVGKITVFVLQWWVPSSGTQPNVCGSCAQLWVLLVQHTAFLPKLFKKKQEHENYRGRHRHHHIYVDKYVFDVKNVKKPRWEK